LPSVGGCGAAVAPTDATVRAAWAEAAVADGRHYARHSPRVVYARALRVGLRKPALMNGCIEAAPRAPCAWRRSRPCLWLPFVGRAAKQCRRALFLPPLSRGISAVFFRGPVVLYCGLRGGGETGCLQRLVAQPLPPQPDGCPRRPPCGWTEDPGERACGRERGPNLGEGACLYWHMVRTWRGEHALWFGMRVWVWP